MSWEDILKDDADREMAEQMWNVYQNLITKDKQGNLEINEQRTLKNWKMHGIPPNPSKEQFIQWYIETHLQPIEKIPQSWHKSWEF